MVTLSLDLRGLTEFCQPFTFWSAAMKSIGQLALPIVERCRSNVTHLPFRKTREKKIALLTTTVEDAVRQIDANSGPLGGTRIALLLLLEMAVERGATPNASIHRTLLRLAEFFRPSGAA